MFKILNTRGKLPNQYLVLPEARFKPGQLASLYRDRNDSNLYCDKSDGLFAIGIIDDIKDESDDSTIGTGRVTVWNVSGLVGQTDQFNATETYLPGNFLFPSISGNLSTIKEFNDQKAVATILVFDNVLTFEWI